VQENREVRGHPPWLAWANRPGRAIAWALSVSLLAVGVGLALHGTGSLGWHAATRQTAQVAFPLFLLAFLTSSLARLWPGPLSRALLARRRAIGLAFATAQLVHGAAILLLARHDPSTLAVDGGLVGGALGFVFVVAMAATSNDAAQRRLGATAWRALHRSGQITLFVIYTVTYASRVEENPSYWLGVLILAAALAIRLAAAVSRR
jgi:methionine sulfoxide reductase heme-binding subunit